MILLDPHKPYLFGKCLVVLVLLYCIYVFSHMNVCFGIECQLFNVHYSFKI
jgi:hypothetical protein